MEKRHQFLKFLCTALVMVSIGIAAGSLEAKAANVPGDGDVNNDKAIDVSDVEDLRKHITGETLAVNSDPNGDGESDVLDLIRLKRFLGGVNDGTGVVVDRTKYNATDSEYTISNASELYGFAVAIFDSSAGAIKTKLQKATITLGDDIVLNAGDAAQWTEKEGPQNEWYSIIAFQGTFNGAGHTISGLYSVKPKDDKMPSSQKGLFINSNSGVTVTDLKLTNGYINVKAGGSGAILGTGYGTFKNIYTDIILENSATNQQYIGGIVGKANKGSLNISGCWSNCRIDSASTGIGGIVGSTDTMQATIENCLNTGNLTVNQSNLSSFAYAGGIVGHSTQNSNTKICINNCLNTGHVVSNTTLSDKAKDGCGGLVGLLNKGSVKHDIMYSYDSTSDIGNGQFNSTKVEGISIDALKGVNAMHYTNLSLCSSTNLNNGWKARNFNIPVPSAFAADSEWFDVEGLTQNYGGGTWLTKEGDKYIGTIDSADALWRCVYKARYEGTQYEKLTLTSDIVVNKAEQIAAKMSGTSEQINQWFPLKDFAGTFEGNGYTISGLYGVATGSDDMGLFASTQVTAKVQNLKVTNSYFCSEQGHVGGIVANGLGVVSGVSVQADLKTTAGKGAGGIVGVVTSLRKDDSQRNENEAHLTITNCQSECNITTEEYYAGGILGNGNAGNPDKTVGISHCLFSGTIYVNGQKDHGGIVGKTGNATDNGHFTITDCLNVGTLVDKSGGAVRIGGIVGNTGAEGNTGTTITNTYFVAKDGSLFTIAIGEGGTNSESNGIDSSGVSNDALLGEGAKTNAPGLEFWNAENQTGYWVTVEGETPILKSFQ